MASEGSSCGTRVSLRAHVRRTLIWLLLHLSGRVSIGLFGAVSITYLHCPGSSLKKLSQRITCVPDQYDSGSRRFTCTGCTQTSIHRQRWFTASDDAQQINIKDCYEISIQTTTSDRFSTRCGNVCSSAGSCCTTRCSKKCRHDRL